MSSGPKVLIVDDEERFRTTLRKLLAAAGLEATAAGSGKDALQELEESDYDVILLDVKMPDMSGIEALAKIKKAAPNIEVIMLTGHACLDLAVEIMKLGGYEYLLKPCPLDDLMVKIDSAYERKLARNGKPRSSGRSEKKSSP
jgi:DNA-binding NtrC family response regulator